MSNKYHKNTERPPHSCYFWVKISKDRGFVPARFEAGDSHPVQIVGSDEAYQLDEFLEWTEMADDPNNVSGQVESGAFKNLENLAEQGCY